MDLYREEILDRYKNPQNIGDIKDATNKATVKNSICGDTLSAGIRISESGLVSEVKFKSIGCMVSTVSADVLADYAIGKNISEVKNIKEEEVLKLFGIDLTPSRRKCALLSLEVLKKAVE